MTSHGKRCTHLLCSYPPPGPGVFITRRRDTFFSTFPISTFSKQAQRPQGERKGGWRIRRLALHLSISYSRHVFYLEGASVEVGVVGERGRLAWTMAWIWSEYRRTLTGVSVHQSQPEWCESVPYQTTENRHCAHFIVAWLTFQNQTFCGGFFC